MEADGIVLRCIESPSDLQDCWAFVRDGLLSVNSRCPSNWIPEDIYHQIKTGISILIIGENKHGDYVGFFVLNKNNASDGVEFFIQAAYNIGGNSIIYDCFNIIIEFCKQHSARRITMLSNRRGWDKLGYKLGFKPVYTQYALEL